MSDAEIAALEDQTPPRSWPFEPYLRICNAEAENLLDLLMDDVCAEWAASFERKPSINRQQAFIDCGSVILANLMRAKCSRWPTTIGMRRGKGALNRERRYRPDCMKAALFITVQDWLMKSGDVEKVKSGFNLPGYSQTSRFGLTEKGVLELEAEDWTFADFKVDRGRETIRLKDDKDRLCGYGDTPETMTMRARLDEINAKLGATEIGTTRPLNIHDKEPDYKGRKVRLYRVFNRDSFDHGGRFYGGWWQNVKSNVRPAITIDGQHTVEADFRGFNPAAILAEAGQLVPEDPYSPIVGANAPKELRDHAKATLAAYLNSKSGTTEEPGDFDSAKWGMTAEDFRAKVLNAFPMVPAMLGTEKGMKLQRLESDLAEAIMLHFVRQGHAILPIHDAFVVQAHLERELVQVMKDTFKARLGQIPHVKVTRSYALR
ncbi:hypothetical protein SAMN04490248_1482 [Salinihabitans flavidus]|uniref:Uncharacterized protein n=2 Tax=Salinihabitans flavidus TaxID=569882 RepID=A0A1H8W7R1_9RHOB|nr:hypothetical protein SAMN04490248_1482 [Salinihabitans flavidus]